MSKELSDVERRAEMYRAALENIAALASDPRTCAGFEILEIASDALADDMQEEEELSAILQIASDVVDEDKLTDH